MESTTHALTLTVEQAAKALGISRSTAYELVHTGDIPSLRLGRRIVIPTARLADKLGLDLANEGGPVLESIRPRSRPSRPSRPRIRPIR